MEEKNNTWRIILDVIVVIVVLIATYSVIKSLNKDKGEYNYCVEWEGGVAREDIPIAYLRDCYNFETKTDICRVIIQPDQQLYVYQNGTSTPSDTYRCIKYAKTISVSLAEDSAKIIPLTE